MDTYELRQKASAFWKNKKALYIVGAILVFFILNPITCIDSGEKGLRFTMGALDNTELTEGVNFSLPFFQKIRVLTIRPIEHTFNIEVGPQGAITKDNQSIGVTVSVFYTYIPGKLVPMWRKYGEEKMLSIITATSLENYKKVAGQYTIFDVAANQEKIRLQMFEMTKANLNKYPVSITEIKITNYDWSEAFEKQIEETMQRAQQVKQKEQELLITEQEAQKEVKLANAKKTAMITLSEGKKESARLEAEAKVLEGEGIRKYNASVSQNQEFELKKLELAIKKIEVERWNGQYVPTNNYGPIPFVTGGIQPTK